MYIRWCQKFVIKVYRKLQFLEYLRTLLRQPTGQSQDNFNFGPSLNLRSSNTPKSVAFGYLDTLKSKKMWHTLMCIPTWNIFFQIALSLDQLYMKKRRVIKFPSKIYFDWFVFIDIHDVRTWNKNFFFFFQFALLSTVPWPTRWKEGELLI